MKPAVRSTLNLVFSLVLALALLPMQAQALASTPEQDELFLQLRSASRKDNARQVEELAARLGDYPIPSYVDYYRLKARLRSAPASEIRAYLAKYDGSAIADRLRNDWLLELGLKRDWATFDHEYPLFALNDDLQVKCYALLSKAAKGQKVASQARELLTAPKSYGEGCQALIGALAKSGQFGGDDLWTQARLAAESGAVSVAKLSGTLAGASARDLESAMNTPTRVVMRGPGKGRARHETYLIALGRLARNSHGAAALALSRASSRLSAAEQAQGWARIALPAAIALDPAAQGYWKKAAGAPLSLEGHQWKVRTALRAGDWKGVDAAIDAMPASLRSDSAWAYWKGRSLLAAGKRERANELFASISDQAHFYGQLALEELGHRITVPERPEPSSDSEVAQMAAKAGFQRAAKFFALGMRFEGTREWNWELRGMNDRQLLAAAEHARRSELLDRMVNTSDRTRREMDFHQRFPSPFRDEMIAATRSVGLDMAWAYGLVRQESRFVLDARSHVGASGLMQLMPKTAKYVARKIGLSDYDHGRVNDINTNIVLGTNYLKMVQNDLDGSLTMATAAYNAGPGRPRSWRSSLPHEVEGAIFAETIPFSETRGYVKHVLSNATYYAALFENRSQSLKERLGSVAPKGFMQTLLP